MAFGSESSGIVYSAHINKAGNVVCFDTMPADGTYSFDSEDATLEDVQLFGLEAILVTKEGHHIIWINEQEGKLYSLSATDMEREEFLKLAEMLAASIRWEETQVTEPDTPAPPPQVCARNLLFNVPSDYTRYISRNWTADW